MWGIEHGPYIRMLEVVDFRYCAPLLAKHDPNSCTPCHTFHALAIWSCSLITLYFAVPRNLVWKAPARSLWSDATHTCSTPQLLEDQDSQSISQQSLAAGV